MRGHVEGHLCSVVAMAEGHDEGVLWPWHLIEEFLGLDACFIPAAQAGELVDAFKFRGEDDDESEMDDEDQGTADPQGPALPAGMCLERRDTPQPSGRQNESGYKDCLLYTSRCV